MSKKTEIQALISLLDEDNEVILKNVTQKLLSYGEEVVFNLENSWEQSMNPIIHERIEDIIHQIQFNSVYQQLKIWLKDPYPDLFKGAEIVSKYQFPDYDTANIRNIVAGIKQKIWIELNNYLTPLETINVFNQVFFGILSFRGEYKLNHDISGYCINHLIETKKGTSITLGILYIIIAQDLNIPIYGVTLYRHFILSFQKGFIEDFNIDNSSQSLFYINAMSGGVIFQREEIKVYLKKMKQKNEIKFFSPASNKELIKELLYYIWNNYTNAKQQKKADEIEKLRSLF